MATVYIQNFYGFENFQEEKGSILRNLIVLFVGLLSFQVLNNHLVVINKKLILCGNSTLTELKASDYVQKELLNIFENIEEAIVTIFEPDDDPLNDLKISYQNFKFKNIIQNMKGINPDLFLTEQHARLLDLKIFKVLRKSN